jgi:hypothetical protein
VSRSAILGAGQEAALVASVRATGVLPGLPDGHYIEGAGVPAVSRATMESFDPSTAQAFARFAAGDAQDVDCAVAAARRALSGPWRRTTPAERGRILARTAALIRAHAAPLAIVECVDAGKRLAEARGDVASAARTFEYYAGACDKLHGRSIPLDVDHLAYTVLEPVGVCAQVVPWNYPLATLARGLAPALAAGCTVVVKPAEQTPMTALLLAQILHEAGLPPGVCNVVTGTGALAGAPLPPGGFAKNDVAFIDPTGVDHDALGAGLKKAIYNYRHGIGLEEDVRTWFPFKVPKTTVRQGRIEPADLLRRHALQQLQPHLRRRCHSLH